MKQQHTTDGFPPYWENIRNMKDDGYDLRLRMVWSAKVNGIKPTARLFRTTVKTVKKWFFRHRENGGKMGSLISRSRRPHRCPHKTKNEVEQQVVALRTRLPGMGAKRMKEEFELPCSHGAIGRIFRANQLVKRRQKKHQRKKNLREMKRRWAIFQQIVTDTKDLTDIPLYWLQMQTLGLPGCQYTARDAKTGLTFLGYAEENSATYACLFADRICRHLADHGLDLDQVTFQTDNGVEFIGGKDGKGKTHGFPHIVEDIYKSHHRRIPPRAHTYQADVETFHRLEEEEFFLIEPFSSKDNFKRKITTYLLYFNLVRKNSYKEHKSPWELIHQEWPHCSKTIAMMPPLWLDEIFDPLKASGGYDLPGHP